MARGRLALLVLMVGSPAFAQFGSAGRSGNSGSHGGSGSDGRKSEPSTFLRQPFPRPFYPALNPLWGSLVQSRPFWGSGFSGGVGSPAGFYGVPFYGAYGADYGAGSMGPVPYPPQAPANITIVMPPQAPMVVQQPAPVPAPAPASSQPALQTESAAPVPTREVVVPASSPAVIAIRDGNVYSASRYWIKGKTLHFIASNGEQHEVPMSMVERLYAPEGTQAEQR